LWFKLVIYIYIYIYTETDCWLVDLSVEN